MIPGVHVFGHAKETITILKWFSFILFHLITFNRIKVASSGGSCLALKFRIVQRRAFLHTESLSDFSGSHKINIGETRIVDTAELAIRVRREIGLIVVF